MSTVRRLLVAMSCVAACTHPTTPPAPPPTPTPSPTPVDPHAMVDAAAQAITAADLRETITQISDDKFAGRGPTTPADAAARAYLIGRLKALGFAPGAPNGQWEQPFDLVGVQAAMPKAWTFRAKGKAPLALAWWDQYIAGSGVQTASGSIKDAELVFVGYGIQAPEYGWDDFKGKDLRGKVLVMLNNDPDWDPALFAGTTRLYYGRWTYKFESAARQGAVGAIIIHTRESAGYPWQVVQTSWSGREFELPAGDEPRTQVHGWLTEDAARKLTALTGHDLAKLVESAHHKEFVPVPLGITTSLEFKNDVTRAPTANVLGVMRGSDPKLAEELVVYTAHHDHLGVGKPDATGDTIYNGALDNGSGCAQLVAIAKAYKALPTAPRRSVLVMFVAGEEQGLLGSSYYATHPTVPAGRLAVDINFDGGNIWGRTHDVTYVGRGKTTLDALVDAEAARQQRVVKPDQFPDRGSFYRSDQFSFARVGVPGVYLGTGTDGIDKPAGWMTEQIVAYETKHYHQPSDEIHADWVFDGMIEDARLGFAIGYAIANGDTLPGWVAGDEFAAARANAAR